MTRSVPDHRQTLWTTWLLVTGAIVLVAGMAGCAGEAANWKLAAGLNEAEAGNLDEAVQLLQAAVEQDPDNDRIKLKLAELLAENQKGDLGLSFCDEVLEKYPNNRDAFLTRAYCLMYLGRFDDCLRDYENAISDQLKKSSVQLNNLAYYRALARRDLPKAARQIQNAIEMEQESDWGSKHLLPFEDRAVVTLGLVSRHVGAQAKTRCFLDRRIEHHQQQWEQRGALLTELAAVYMRGDFPLTPSQTAKTDVIRMERELTRRSLGLLLATRALMGEDLGSFEQVDRDRVQIRELGFEIDDLVQSLPDDPHCLEVLEKATMFLDTRGFVLARLQWQDEDLVPWLRQLEMDQPGLFSSYSKAIDDLNLSVMSAEILDRASQGAFCNRYDLPTSYVRRLRRGSKRMRAVLLYHRMKAHEKAGQFEQAEDDAEQIRGLGFEPDESLTVAARIRQKATSLVPAV